jgi:exodeoxyribonuclease VII small subunit
MARKSITPENFNFEAALEQLNQLVEKMEAGGLSLEDSLRSFEQGIALTRQCQQALQAAEQKVQILLEKNGKTSLEPYSDNEEPT